MLTLASMIVVPFAALSIFNAALAQTYPVKPVRLVIPYPPGGVDITIRQILPYVDADLGQPVVIDYRPGASGIIGSEFVSRAEPDGYTLLATASNPWVVSPAMRKQTPYHPITSFTPISTVSQGGVNLIVANLDFPPNNVAEMIAYAKKFPDKVAWATSGLGSSWHLDAEYMNILAGTKILHAPFAGFGPMIPATVSGQVQMALLPFQFIQPMLTAKKVKMIGVMSTQAAAQALAPPGVQFVKEILPEYEAGPSWIGIGGPAKLPRPIVMRLNQAVNKAIREPKVQENFAPQRTIVAGSTPEEFAERIRRDYELAVKIVKTAGIPLE
ncbi:MAG: Bug family tripartite tricarboxylate transporter substrate binding protein [Burkholderiales bacterium]